MKALIQRVKQARVEVDNRLISSINAGMLVFVGIDADDTDSSVKALAERLLKYRLFADNQGKMNLNIQQSDGEILLVSQFTLSAETKRGCARASQLLQARMKESGYLTSRFLI